MNETLKGKSADTKPSASRRKFLTGAAAATTGAAITGFPMISVAQSPVVLKMQGAWGAKDEFGFGNSDAFAQLITADRAIHDTIASLIVHGALTRHPTLRVASIENGSDWMHILAKRLRKQANQTPWVFKEDPVEVLRRQVWVTPYLEEDLGALAELIGVLRKRTTIVVIEHDMPFLFGLADRIYVIHWGQVIAQGTPDELRDDPWVARSNLGQLASPPQGAG